MTKKIQNVLNEVLDKIQLSKKDFEIIKNSSNEFLEKFEKKLKKLKIDAEIFIGGSFAKKTLIKKDKQDVDIFVRFDKKYKDISKLTKKILGNSKDNLIVHGSRDYFRIKINKNFFIELIPVKKIKSKKEFENITDLSYFHVKYINKKIKNKKLLEEIMLAKAFCFANNCYGAESYINGFSGYSLELLIYYYKSFLKFIKAMSKVNEDKLVIDIEKDYKNKQQVLMDVNSSKLDSPIILIDPTYKQRNALAALSEETFVKFKKVCKKFLKNPSIKDFEIKKTDLERIKKNALKNKQEFILLEAKTNKQQGDVAGTKLLKFFKHLNYEIKKYFDVKKKGFNYNGKKVGGYFFVVKKKKEILHQGPFINDKKNVKRFKKQHKKTFIKNKKIYSKEKINFSLNDFIKKWKIKNKKKIKEMSIKNFEILK